MKDIEKFVAEFAVYSRTREEARSFIKRAALDLAPSLRKEAIRDRATEMPVSNLNLESAKSK